ncbi:MAG: glycosyltransferase [Deltaproteobacteria bacterium]|nr:glycosyltransferase [Deltaproteobacteria bacterium]
MSKKIKNYLKLLLLFLITLLKVIFIDFDFIKVKFFIKACLAQFKLLINGFCNQNPMRYTHLFKNQNIIADYSDFQLHKLKIVTQGLYETLKKKSNRTFTYSILIPVYKPKLQFFKILLESCLNQSVTDCEILLGFDGPQPAEITNYISQLIAENETAKQRIRFFEFDRSPDSSGISTTTNQLAEMATGEFLLFVDHDDWIRSDLLYRYDLLLRQHQDNEKTVIYCDEFKIDEYNNRIHGTYLRKPDSFTYPYFFINWVCHCLLVSKKNFLQVGGLRKICDGAQDYDLILKLSSNSSRFLRCPIGLYAWRVHANSTALSTSVKSYVNDAGIFALKEFVDKNKLDWEITAGEVDTTYFAFPKINFIPEIQVIMPFKDGESLTEKALRSLITQKNVKLNITLVNNNSTDPSINKRLQEKFKDKLRIEIINYDDAFNFSRICNFAARNSMFSNSPYLLFINNDVELKDEAIFEMARWIEQPKIGAVGCKLLYPNGSLQHGGIDCRDDHYEYEVCWGHTNYQVHKGAKGFHSVQRVVDAVTAACMLMKRTIFEEVNGFNEDMYPIAFSDTDLCARINQKGYYCFYNPVATGIHFESITREKNAIEDFDSSATMFGLMGNVRPRKSFYYR